MTSPELPADDPLKGSFVLAALDPAGARVTYLRGWERSRWWNSPMFFWDDFSADGELGPESKDPGTGRRALARPHHRARRARRLHLPAGLAFPQSHAAPLRLERRRKARKTRSSAITTPRASPTPGPPPSTPPNIWKRWRRRRAASPPPSANPPFPPPSRTPPPPISPRWSHHVCFRTADGEFHGFEGANDHAGCCHGSCAHVWNYETATAHLFPTFARSLRARQLRLRSRRRRRASASASNFPHKGDRFNLAAADGQMGQIMHAYLDWMLSGDTAWLRDMWPRIKKAIEFAWVPGGWDADQDGVLEGVQHNTYDVEFYGPNPMCGIFYLGALRAGEEMARAAGDTASAAEYRALFERGSKWIDANLFNGEFYMQKIRGVAKDKIAPNLLSDMGSANTETPEYQVGGGCLLDQLIGQYLAEVAGLGPLVSDGEHPQDARVHLALQLQAHARRPR